MTIPSWLKSPPVPRLEDLPANLFRATVQVLVVALPRTLRNTLVPGLTVVVASGFLGIELGAVLALLVAGGLFAMDRRAGRAGFIAGLVMAFVFLSAVVAVISRELSLFFLPVAAVDVVMGTYCIASVMAGRPLFAAASDDFVKLPESAKASQVYHDTARTTTLIGVGYFYVRAVLRLAAFLVLPAEWFIAVAFALEIVGDIGLIATCVRMNVRNLRNPEFIAAVSVGARTG